MRQDKGGKKKMTTTLKPIRPTEIEYSSSENYRDFIGYATSNKKTDSDSLNRLRKLMAKHKSKKGKE